ncbi:hypothetical protein BGZ70_003034 [Mortierella alpina]|uniref:Invertebrate defensins family profile domain-containing protein n=1 Tax=Mortierella alpina TaxID=64518 RepID=A0A9P6IUV4_MORAP|nr:hypothetical protein BGZ70_003034 [Mortierella alpina]
MLKHWIVLLAMCAMLVLAKGKDESLNRRCTVDNPDSKCGIQCLFYRRYTGGYCNKKENICYCTTKY